MFFNYDFVSVRKVGLITLLLAQPMFIQAQEASGVAAEGSSSEQQRTFQFPGWPAPRKVVRKERIPPAPPGPYMSSALSGSSVNGPSFEPVSKPAVRVDSPRLPAQAFSPDMPWYGSSKSPDRWRPQNGYSYVKPPVKRQHYPAMPYNMPPNYNYGNRAPVMNWPGAARPNAYNSNGYPQNGGYARSHPGMNYSAMQSRQPARQAVYPATGKP